MGPSVITKRLANGVVLAGASCGSRWKVIQEVARCEDVDAAIAVQDEQVSVASDDDGGCGSDGAGRDNIIVGIPRYGSCEQPANGVLGMGSRPLDASASVRVRSMLARMSAMSFIGVSPHRPSEKRQQAQNGISQARIGHEMLAAATAGLSNCQGIRRRLVSQIVASWNGLDAWLRQVDGLRQAA
jgi:hypothetical protein